MIEGALAGLFGLLIGSFLNVCIHRMPKEESIVRPRSHCPSCKKLIAWYDNVPILSYLVLGGKCRHCSARISPRYPLVELVTGLLFFCSVYTRGANALGYKLCAFSAILVALIFIDMEERILPDELTLGGALAGLGFAVVTPPPSSLTVLFLPPTMAPWVHSVVESLIGGVVAAGLLWLVGELYFRLRRREGLGFGDVKMLITIGVFLGLPGALLTVFLGSVIGAVGGMLYIWLAKEDYFYELPYGSFLGAAAIVVGLFGDPFFAWYWSLG